MRTLRFIRTAALALAISVLPTAVTIHAVTTDSEADKIRDVEKKRLRSLVDANVEIATLLHAEDFELINPLGEVFTRDQYLGEIASGEHDYLVFEPASEIVVRIYDRVAVIRYQSNIKIVVRGNKVPLLGYWHTDLYEKRDGRWQVVWSHATGIN